MFYTNNVGTTWHKEKNRHLKMPVNKGFLISNFVPCLATWTIVNVNVGTFATMM